MRRWPAKGGRVAAGRRLRPQRGGGKEWFRVGPMRSAQVRGGPTAMRESAGASTAHCAHCATVSTHAGGCMVVGSGVGAVVVHRPHARAQLQRVAHSAQAAQGKSPERRSLMPRSNNSAPLPRVCPRHTVP
jgi:hypothetical protein